MAVMRRIGSLRAVALTAAWKCSNGLPYRMTVVQQHCNGRIGVKDKYDQLGISRGRKEDREKVVLTLASSTKRRLECAHLGDALLAVPLAGKVPREEPGCILDRAVGLGTKSVREEQYTI